MAKDESGLKWPAWPTVGAVGAGRHDESAPAPDSFGLTPSALAEQAATLIVPVQDAEHPVTQEEVPGAEPESPG